MKEMYKDNAGNWHYGYKGEKLTEVSYSTNSVPNSIPIEWIVDWLTRQHIPASHTCDDYYAVEMMLDDWEKENEEMV